MDLSPIAIPDQLKPSDGRFGSGPSKIRTESLRALAATGSSYMGTSHRRETVRAMVRRLQEGLGVLFSLPEGYEVVLGNGGTTVLWDAIAFGLINNRSQHYVCGEFSARFADAVAATPHLSEPEIISSEAGTHPQPRASESADLYALIHNETSTGVQVPVTRPGFGGALVAVDATSAAGGLRVDPRAFDFYYFAPQKGLSSDGGLWIALASPSAIDRIGRIGESDRWRPPSLDLQIALHNSRKNQTYNTPALATIWLAAQQVDWINDNGGLEFAASRCDKSAEALYSWAEASDFATPFVHSIEQRSHVVGTIDFVSDVDAGAIAATLRANGIVDTESYRKLGRNQLRIAMFPAIDPGDVIALTRCIDYIVERLV